MGGYLSKPIDPDALFDVVERHERVTAANPSRRGNEVSRLILKRQP